MTSAWETLDVTAGAIRLHVRRQRAGERPLVLLHGLGVSGAVWQGFARRLSPPWQAIAPDLRGHGESDKPPGGYHAEDYAADVAAMIDTLGIAPIPVAGHSLGALVALALAAGSPGHVSAVALLDPPLDSERRNPDIATVYRLRKAPPGELEAYLSVAALAPVFRQASDAAFEAMMSAPAGAPWAWEARHRISAPLLLVQADPSRGGVVGDAAAQDFVAPLPHAELLTVPGAAHTVHVSHGPLVAEALIEFLERHAQ